MITKKSFDPAAPAHVRDAAARTLTLIVLGGTGAYTGTRGTMTTREDSKHNANFLHLELTSREGAPTETRRADALRAASRSLSCPARRQPMTRR